MKLNAGSTEILIAGAAIIGLYLFFKKQAKDAADALAKFNKGTPYDNAVPGTVGTVLDTLGNAANQASGGYLSDLGTQFSDWLANLTMPYNPNAPSSSGVPDWGVTPGWTDPNAPPSGIALLPTQKSSVADNYWNSSGVLLPTGP